MRRGVTGLGFRCRPESRSSRYPADGTRDNMKEVLYRELMLRTKVRNSAFVSALMPYKQLLRK
jgi:hypothetical protein